MLARINNYKNILYDRSGINRNYALCGPTGHPCDVCPYHPLPGDQLSQSFNQHCLRAWSKLHHSYRLPNQSRRFHEQRQHHLRKHNLRWQCPFLLLHTTNRFRFWIQHASQEVLPKFLQHHDFWHPRYASHVHFLCSPNLVDLQLWVDENVGPIDTVSAHVFS